MSQPQEKEPIVNPIIGNLVCLLVIVLLIMTFLLGGSSVATAPPNDYFPFLFIIVIVLFAILCIWLIERYNKRNERGRKSER